MVKRGLYKDEWYNKGITMIGDLRNYETGKVKAKIEIENNDYMMQTLVQFLKCSSTVQLCKVDIQLGVMSIEVIVCVIVLLDDSATVRYKENRIGQVMNPMSHFSTACTEMIQ